MFLSRISLLFIAICISFAVAAQQYTTSDKRAIKHFEAAATAIGQQQIAMGLEEINKAIDRDDQFVEAWLLKADLHIENREIDEAIAAMERSVEVNPSFFPNKYFTLGQLYISQARYADAHAQFTRLLKFPEVRPELKQQTNRLLESCEFAIEAMKNPVPFEPENLGEGVNTWMSEYYPSITVDGRQLLFTREVQTDPSRRGQEDFFMSEWDGKQWDRAQPLYHINTPGNEGAPAISPDGQTMVFTACDLYGSYGPDREGFGSCDLFFTYKMGDGWARARNMGSAINTAHWETQPSISADGKTLYFVRGNRNPAERNSNIYMSKLNEDGEWERPVKLSATINTDRNEESVLIHPDGKTLYFSSDGHPGMGGLDIFKSTRIGDNEWTTPENLGYPINTHADENSLLVSPMGDIAYFSSDRPGGFGGLDLYSFELPEHLRPEPVGYVRGLVYDAESRKPLYARFELIDIESEEVVVTSFSDSQDGSFLVALPYNRRYALNASKKGYLFYSDHFDLMSSRHAMGQAIEVPMNKVAGGQTIVLNNVFFDTDKFDLKPESRAELNKLAEFMAMNPEVQIEVGGHTDDQGSAAHNQTLSQNRATAVKDYLIKQGVSGDRLKAKGYGQDKPIADNDTESGRAQNRRTEVKVLGE